MPDFFRCCPFVWHYVGVNEQFKTTFENFALDYQILLLIKAYQERGSGRINWTPGYSNGLHSAN